MLLISSVQASTMVSAVICPFFCLEDVYDFGGETNPEIAGDEGFFEVVPIDWLAAFKTVEDVFEKAHAENYRDLF